MVARKGKQHHIIIVVIIKVVIIISSSSTMEKYLPKNVSSCSSVFFLIHLTLAKSADVCMCSSVKQEHAPSPAPPHPHRVCGCNTVTKLKLQKKGKKVITTMDQDPGHVLDPYIQTARFRGGKCVGKTARD